MKPVVLVIAYNRPKHLYVTLSSIFRSVNIKDYLVYVSIDGSPQQEMFDVVSEFELDRIIIRGKRFDNLNHITIALADAFEITDKVVMLEDDHLIRSDCLTYCLSKDTDRFCVTLSAIGDLGGTFRPLGNIFYKDRFIPLKKFIDSKEYVGKPFPLHDGWTIQDGFNGYDVVFHCYMECNNLKVECSQEYYVAHFGLVGMNHPKCDASIVGEINSRMFAGEKEQWLDNIVRIICNEEFDPSLKMRLFPAKEFAWR